MKVRCVRIIDAKGQPQEKSSWLTIGRREEFEVVSSRLPCSWVAAWRKDMFELTPERWTRSGFWEDFYNGKPDAVKIFDEERGNIVRDDT